MSLRRERIDLAISRSFRTKSSISFITDSPPSILRFGRYRLPHGCMEANRLPFNWQCQRNYILYEKERKRRLIDYRTIRRDNINEESPARRRPLKSS